MVEGVNSSMIYLIYSKNFYKCYNIHPHSKTIKNMYLTLDFYNKFSLLHQILTVLVVNFNLTANLNSDRKEITLFVLGINSNANFISGVSRP
jgi:hypothetical protein